MSRQSNTEARKLSYKEQKEKRTQLEQEMRNRVVLKLDPREEINQLPDELVLQLFHLIERADLIHCSIVCRQWYRIGQREEFNWTYITKIHALEHPAPEHFKNSQYEAYEWLGTIKNMEELKSWQSDPLHNGTPVRIGTLATRPSVINTRAILFDAKDNIVAFVQLYTKEKITFDFNKEDNLLLWKYIIEPAEYNEFNEGHKIQRRWKISLYFDVKALDYLIIKKNMKSIPNEHYFIGVVFRDWTNLSALKLLSEENNSNFVNRPLLKNNTRMQQPVGFKNGIKLYKYQLDAITWMKSVEDRIGQDQEFVSPCRWRGSVVYIDHYNYKIVHPRKLDKYRDEDPIHGGILADDHGLGKTFEVIGLILSSPPKTDLEPHPELIASKSTLIMCPEHLCQQWHDEITRATTLSALVVRNYDDLEKCTYEDFMTQYDVIVCPYELLASIQYVCLPSRETNGSLTIDERNDNLRKTLEKLKTNNNFSDVTAPIIELFFFHRVVFDEGHHLANVFDIDGLIIVPKKITDGKHNHSVAMYKQEWGRSKWFVSAPPFGEHTCDILNFLLLDEVAPAIEDYRNDMIFREFLWRNTKESVKDELVIPETLNNVVD